MCLNNIILKISLVLHQTNKKNMKKTLSIFAIAGIMLVSACGPSAEELAKKEQATKDSIAAVEKARQDSLDSVMKAQMTADSIAQAEASALADAEAEKNSKSTPNKPAGKKEEPKKEEPKKEDPKRPARDGLNNSGGNSNNETKPAGERPKRGGMNPKVN
jgi:hypothetical protein